MTHRMLNSVRAAVLGTIILGATLTASAQLQSYSTLVSGVTVSASTATNIFKAIDISLQKDLVTAIETTGDQAGTGNISYLLSPSLDGTTNKMDYNINLLVAKALNGNTRIFYTTNFAEAKGAIAGYPNIGAYPFLILRYITNADGTANATNTSFYYANRKPGRASGGP